MSRYKCKCGYVSRKAEERDLHAKICGQGSFAATHCSPASESSRQVVERVVAKSKEGRHRRFWMETPAGNEVHILGNPRMPAATKRALGEMMDAAVKAYNEGKLPLPES